MDKPFRSDINRALKKVAPAYSDEEQLAGLKEAAKTAGELAQWHRQKAGGRTAKAELDIERRIALYALELTEKSWECFGEAAQSRALSPRFERLAEAIEAEAREIQEKRNAASWGEGY